jgi:hypothetical protein
MVFRQRYYFEPEQEKPGCRYTGGAAVRLVDPTKLARHAAAIRAASLITDTPSSMLSLRTSSGSTCRRHRGRSHTSAAVERKPRRSSAHRDGRYVSALLGPRGRGRGVTDRTLLVSGDAWARAAASLTGSGWARER